VEGVGIPLVSIVVRGALVVAKERVGPQLNSAAIRAEANCTRVCIYMAVLLRAASSLYAPMGRPYLDALGSLGLAWFSFKDARAWRMGPVGPCAAAGTTSGRGSSSSGL